jgi:hypothetical protein
LFGRCGTRSGDVGVRVMEEMGRCDLQVMLLRTQEVSDLNLGPQTASQLFCH